MLKKNINTYGKFVMHFVQYINTKGMLKSIHTIDKYDDSAVNFATRISRRWSEHRGSEARVGVPSLRAAK